MIVDVNEFTYYALWAAIYILTGAFLMRDSIEETCNMCKEKRLSENRFSFKHIILVVFVQVSSLQGAPASITMSITVTIPIATTITITSTFRD